MNTLKSSADAALGDLPSPVGTRERLRVAEQLLLAPFGLERSHLSRALAEISSRGADDADLYFQYTRSEGWSL
jgi:TldD protein